MPIHKQNFRETLIDMIDRLPGIEAFEQNNLIRIRCYGCGNRITFDNGTAITALGTINNSRPDLPKFMEYVRKCINEHHCSKQLPATIETTSDRKNWSAATGVPLDPYKQKPVYTQPKPKFTRRFDLE